jgi:hypothetical protein
MTDNSEFIPGQLTIDRRLDLRVNQQVRIAGHYQLKAEKDTIKGLGFNYNRSESVMQFLTPEQLQSQADRYLPGQSGVLADTGKPLAESIKEMSQGTPLWKLFIILALVFLGVEIVLLRFWNN